VVCFDIKTRRVVWEGRIPFDPDPDMPLAMEFSPDVLYAWSGRHLFGWSAETGDVLFPALEGVSSPPLFLDGFLAFGTDDGQLVIADAFTGRFLRVLDLGERVTARPWIEEGNIVIGTQRGNIFVVNPDAIR
jgi:outer membrane protein assembly factor BamB